MSEGTNAIRKLVVVTTPRRDSLAGIAGFLGFGRSWRQRDPRIVLLIAMPSQTMESVRNEILAMLQPREFMGEMAPEADGCGPIFKFAMDCAFRLVPDAGSMLHLPIDIAWGEIHREDVQLSIPKMSAILDLDRPALLLGDYEPLLWKNGGPEPHLTKALIGKYVLEQLSHYGLDANFRRLDLKEARTEFFAANRQMFESAARAGAFAPFDPIPFVALHAWKMGFAVHRVYLGKFYESDANAEAMRVRWQLIRVADQISNAYLGEQHVTSMAEAAAQTEHWKRTVVEGKEKAFDATARIFQKLQNAQEGRAK